MTTRTPNDDRSAADETELLLRFLEDRDRDCPRCRYNLRSLTQPVCPECGEELKLTVGRRKINDAPFILTLAPCIFSGICAIILSCTIAFAMSNGRSSPPPWIWAIDAFGVLSGTCGLTLFVKRRAFMKLDRGAQLLSAFITWAIHISAFVAVLIIG
jgi:hypothetical protein